MRDRAAAGDGGGFSEGIAKLREIWDYWADKIKILIFFHKKVELVLYLE